MIGTQVVISMGELRSIRVLVLGEVGTAGLLHRQWIGNRHQRLVRQRRRQENRFAAQYPGETQGRAGAALDLYDLLINGDTSDDVRLHARRRDIHSAGGYYRGGDGRNTPPGDL